MKWFYLILCVSTLEWCRAQVNSDFNNKLFAEVISFLEKEKKITADKLITLNIWSPTNKMSRDLNTEFEKTNSVYFKAKLKGGSKGVVSVIFCSDKDEVKTSIILNKDGIAESIYLVKGGANNVDLTNLLKNKPVGFNIVFDKDGNVIYEGLKPDAVFKSFNKLVTR